MKLISRQPNATCVRTIIIMHPFFCRWIGNDVNNILQGMGEFGLLKMDNFSMNSNRRNVRLKSCLKAWGNMLICMQLLKSR
jgi:hypothetical protein